MEFLWRGFKGGSGSEEVAEEWKRKGAERSGRKLSGRVERWKTRGFGEEFIW